MSKEEEKIASKIRAMLNCDPEEFYKKYKRYKNAEEAFKKLYDPFKEQLLAMHQGETFLPKDIVIEGLKLVYVAPSTRTTIDSKKLKEEEPELAKKFSKTTDVSATIRLEDI